MFQSVRVLLMASLLGFSLVTCKRGTDNPQPVLQVDPQIVALRLEGMPDQNIRIDQEKREITITLPDRFTIRQPKTSFVLTSGSQVLYKAGERYRPGVEAIDVGRLPEDAQFVGVAAQSAAEELPASQVITYKLRLVQPGKLAIRLIPEGTFNTYTIGEPDGFVLVADNFYDGNEYGTQLTLTPKGATAAEPVVIRSSQTAQYISDAGSKNTLYPTQIRVRIPDNAALLPGEYRLEMKKADGRSAVSSDLLVVKKGVIKLGKAPRNLVPQRSVNGNEVTVEGQNLFESPTLEVELQHPDGTVLRRKPLRFSRTGTELTFAPGSGAKPGHYLVRLLDNGQPVSACYRLAVTRTAEQPSITELVPANGTSTLLENDFCNPNQPLFISRTTADGGKLQLLLRTAPLPGTAIQTKLKLVSVDQPTVSLEVPFDVDINADDAVLDYWTTSQVLPLTIPAGRYRLRVLVTDRRTNQTQESEPFERVIDLR